MIKKTLKFKDLDDNDREEDHYFHLSVNELLLIDSEIPGGFVNFLTVTTQSGNTMEILSKFRDIIGRSYGQRDSGTSFHKSDKITQDFLDSLAYEALFEELFLSGNPDKAVEFINGLVPASLAKQLAEQPQNVTAAQLETARQTSNIPDPNGLDTDAGTWPNADTYVDPDIDRLAAESGLAHPWNDEKKGALLPWANREPTSEELRTMNRLHMAEIYQRKNSGWKP